MPRPAQAADPARLAERREVVGEARDGLVGGQRAVGEPVGTRACWTSASASRVGSVVRAKTAPTQAMATTRHPTAVAVATASSVDAQRPDAGDLRRGRVAVRGAEHDVADDDDRGDGPQRREGPCQVARRDAAEAEPGDEGDGRDQTSGGHGWSVSARPISHTTAIASLSSGLGPAEHARRLRSSATATAARSSRRPRRTTIQPSSSATIRVATSGTNRSSWVAAMRHAPAVEVLVEDAEQALVAEAVLAERRLVEDEHRRASHERARQGQPPLLAAGQPVGAARPERRRAAGRGAP